MLKADNSSGVGNGSIFFGDSGNGKPGTIKISGADYNTLNAVVILGGF